jgi:hypothetical protein
MITSEQSKKILQLIDSKNPDNIDLAINILKNQNVSESFFEMLKIASQWHEESRLLRSGIFNVKPFADYIKNNINLYNISTRSIYVDLDFYLKIYESYIKHQCPYKHDTNRIKAERKELILSYNLPENKTIKKFHYVKNKKRTK